MKGRTKHLDFLWLWPDFPLWEVSSTKCLMANPPDFTWKILWITFLNFSFDKETCCLIVRETWDYQKFYMDFWINFSFLPSKEILALIIMTWSDEKFKPHPQEELINYPKDIIHLMKEFWIITSDYVGKLRWTQKKLIMKKDTEFFNSSVY